MFINHYKALGLEPFTPTEKEVKHAFRRLAKIYHPDRPRGDTVQFLEIYAAYQMLADPEARAKYDAQMKAYLKAKRDGTLFESPSLVVPPSRLRYPVNIEALARRGLLRRKFRKRERHYYLRLNHDLELPLAPEELRESLVVQIPLVAIAVCPDCRGSDTHCPSCKGEGSYKTSRIFNYEVPSGLVNHQVLEINLQYRRPEPLVYFRKKHLRVKVVVDTSIVRDEAQAPRKAQEEPSPSFL